MDPVLLKRSLRAILKTLGLNGTILRHEIDQDGQLQLSLHLKRSCPKGQNTLNRSSPG